MTPSLDPLATKALSQRFGSRLVSVCAWCGRVRTDNGWLFSHVEVSRLKACRRVTHGICPNCIDRLMYPRK